MSNHRYTTPEKGTLDWHEPLNENFAQLDRDIEIRDTEANRDEYEPAAKAKFFATDSGAIYTGDGEAWQLVGYAARAISGNIGHYVSYADGLEDEPVNRFIFDSDERLEVTRLSFPIKGVSNGSTVSDTLLRGYAEDELLVEIEGNTFVSAAADQSETWTTTAPSATVTVTNMTGEPIAAIPKVWANIRRAD